MQYHALTATTWNAALPGHIAGLLLIGMGIATLIVSMKGSPRYRIFLAAWGIAVLIMLAAIWLQPVIRDANMHKALSISGSFDPVQKEEALAYYYGQRAYLLGFLISGLLMGLLSLLFRKDRASLQ